MLPGLYYLLSRTSWEADDPQTDLRHDGDLDRLLAINEYQKSGLIFCKRYHAEFAGPGSLVRVEPQVCSIVAIGRPEIIEAATLEARQRAYGRRIQWMRWLQKITKHPRASDRAERLLHGLEAFFGRSIVQDLPDEVLALLVGVLPSTIAQARSPHRHVTHANLDQADKNPEASVVICNAQTLQVFSTTATPFTVSEPLTQEPLVLPRSA